MCMKTTTKVINYNERKITRSRRNTKCYIVYCIVIILIFKIRAQCCHSVYLLYIGTEVQYKAINLKKPTMSHHNGKIIRALPLKFTYICTYIIYIYINIYIIPYCWCFFLYYSFEIKQSMMLHIDDIKSVEWWHKLDIIIFHKAEY